MAPRRSERAELIADTALAVLAERGMRGLTHRAVDEAAGLPPGSTSNHARTRAALLEAAVLRLADLEARVLDGGETALMAVGPDGLADALSLALHRSTTRGRALTVARFELALEATRRPELRAVYDTAGRRFREPLVRLLGAAGSADPERHALSLVSWLEGVMFHSVVGAASGVRLSREQIRASTAEMLNGLLSGDGGARA